jgi:hypothetical protein
MPLPARRLTSDEPSGCSATWAPAGQPSPPGASKPGGNALLGLVLRPDMTTFRPQRDILD